VAAAQSVIGNGSMVHRLDFDLGLHRLVAAADGSDSRDYLLAPNNDQCSCFRSNVSCLTVFMDFYTKVHRTRNITTNHGTC